MIPTMWQRFNAYPGGIPGQLGKTAFGVCCNGDDAGNFEYIAGVEVSDFSGLPAELSRVRIPGQRYLIFTHADHIATIRGTIGAIWNHWLPASGYHVADSPNIERYDQSFDPLTGTGGVEIWIPIQDR
jgi:AraC family transcriptional regulator